MALDDRAVLVLQHSDGPTGEFHLIGPEYTDELDVQYLMDDAGQKIREVINFIDDEADAGGQSGFSLNAGQGQDTVTFSWDGGHERDEYNGVDVQWGDGSAGTDQWDATGADTLTQAQVLKWWARNSRADSFRSQAYLHWGQWTDGSIDGDAGFFGEPIVVTIQSLSLEKSDREPSTYSGRIELKRTQSASDLAESSESSPFQIPDI